MDNSIILLKTLPFCSFKESFLTFNRKGYFKAPRLLAFLFSIRLIFTICSILEGLVSFDPPPRLFLIFYASRYFLSTLYSIYLSYHKNLIVSTYFKVKLLFIIGTL